MLFLRTLGDLSLSSSDGEEIASGIKPLLILAVLARSPGFRAERRYVATLLWPGVNRTRALASLRQALHELTRLGCGHVIEATNGELRLLETMVEVDLWAFDRAVEDDRYRDVTYLYRGPFLAGFRGQLGRELEHWAEAEDSRINVALDQGIAEAVHSAIQADLLEGAVELARRRVSQSPLSERANLVLVEALEAADRLVEARQAAEEFIVVLDRDLGDSPSRPIRLAVERIEVALQGGGEPPPDPGPGRDAEVEAALPPPPQLVETPARFPKAAYLIGFACVLLISVISIQLLRGAEPKFTILVQGSFGDTIVGDISISQDRVSFRPWEYRGHEPVPSPDGSRVAFTKPGSEGPDVFVRDADGREITVSDDPSDDFPLEWSPDGRRLLYERGWLDEDQGVYRVALGIWEAGEDRVEFSAPGFDDRIRASWSPDGTLIAVTSGSGNLSVYDPTGDLRRIADFLPGTRIQIAGWSPDGRRILARVETEEGMGLAILEPGDNRFRRFDLIPGDVHAATWITRNLVLAVTAFPHHPGMFLADIDTGNVTLLHDDLPEIGIPTWSKPQLVEGESAVQALRQILADRPWQGIGVVDSLRLEGPTQIVSPGEHLFFRVVPLDSMGRELHLPNATFEWSVDSESLLSLGDGHIQVIGEGQGRLSVRIPGVCTTSRQIVARRPVRSSVAPVFTEDWSAGITPNWVPHGSPRPEVLPGSGPDGAAALFTNGDQSFTSGVVSKRGFDLTHSITVEALIKTPLTGSHFQDWMIGFYPYGTLLHPIPDSWAPRWPLAVNINGGGQALNIVGPARPESAPLPDRLEEWRSFAVQVNPSGEVALLVDGSVYFRARVDLSALGDSVFLNLAGNSLGTTILHGPVAVYEGELYQIRWPSSG